MDRLRVLAVHRWRLILEGLRAVLEARDDLDVIAEIANVDETVRLHRLCRPDVTILGTRLAGGLATDALDRLRAEFPGCRVAMLREDTDPAAITMIRRLGGGPGVALPRPPRLTAREREVLQLLALGRRNAAIAEALGISAETVKTYVKNVFDKLGVSDRGTAAAVALRAGLVELDD